MVVTCLGEDLSSSRSHSWPYGCGEDNGSVVNGNSESDRRVWVSSVSSVRLLKGSNNVSVEDRGKENLKNNCSESKKEVAVLISWRDRRRGTQDGNERWIISDFVLRQKPVYRSSCRKRFISWRSRSTMRCRLKMSWSRSTSRARQMSDVFLNANTVYFNFICHNNASHLSIKLPKL